MWMIDCQSMLVLTKKAVLSVMVNWQIMCPYKRLVKMEQIIASDSYLFEEGFLTFVFLKVYSCHRLSIP